jgi:hypothetical protein
LPQHGRAAGPAKRDCARGDIVIEGKNFFFEKKKQKTFANLAAASPDKLGQYPKVFWFVFLKKNCFLPFDDPMIRP